MAESLLDPDFEELKKRAEAMRPKYPEMGLKALLEDTPQDTNVYITDLMFNGPNSHCCGIPSISLHCDNEICSGPRQFTSSGDIYLGNQWHNGFLTYTCRNCNSRQAHFALRYTVQKAPTTKELGRGIFCKLGQSPAFGPQTPSKLMSLVGPDRDAFLQGRRAENRGMGVGAFAYYRRVVENQKNRIIGKISEVARVLGSTSETDTLFGSALTETQFSKSVNMVKDVIPQTLMIGGRNPLLLLHSALSKGLHDPDMTDERCLALAQSIRIVLGELAERASTALKDDQEIQSALSILLGASAKTNTGAIE